MTGEGHHGAVRRPPSAVRSGPVDAVAAEDVFATEDVFAAEDEGPVACLHCLAAGAEGALATPLPAVGDEEGARLPDGLPPVVDAHVHLFPDRIFEAIWRWFGKYGWPIRYELHAREVIAFQKARGVEKIVALHYAHVPGLAREMNRWMAELVRDEPSVIGLATVFPGEDGAARILEDAFADGLAGVKLHCHVQCFSPDDDAMGPIYEACSRAGRPLVIHAGREPKSPAYKCDPHALCSVDRVERVLRAWPALKLVVPHLGADETDGYRRLVERYGNLWLDTTMAIADFFPFDVPVDLIRSHPGRVMYGTDFPNLPYAWDREVKKLLAMRLGDDALASVLGGTARALYGSTG